MSRSSRLLPLLLLVAACRSAPRSEAPLLVHSVFFELREPDSSVRAQLIEGCKTLEEIPGVAWLWVGERALELNREVNDKDFDVALHVAFDDMAAHDRYQEHPIHVALLEQFAGTWSSVRVLDAWER